VRDGFLGRGSVAPDGRLGRFLRRAGWLRRTEGGGCWRKRGAGVDDSRWGPRGPRRREMVDDDGEGAPASSGGTVKVGRLGDCFRGGWFSLLLSVFERASMPLRS